MHLASISSQEENDNLEKHIKDFGKLTMSTNTINNILLYTVAMMLRDGDDGEVKHM